MRNGTERLADLHILVFGSFSTFSGCEPMMLCSYLFGIGNGPFQGEMNRNAAFRSQIDEANAYVSFISFIKLHD